MQFIALKFFAAVADSGLIAAAVTLLADRYFDQTRVRTAGRSRV